MEFCLVLFCFSVISAYRWAASVFAVLGKMVQYCSLEEWGFSLFTLAGCHGTLPLVTFLGSRWWRSYEILLLSKMRGRGAWVAPSVKCPTLGFGSGQDLTVGGIESMLVGLYADSVDPAWDSLSLSPCPSPAWLSLSFSLSVSQNK